MQFTWHPIYYFLITQLVKTLPAMRETWVDPWVGKIPWRRERLPTPVFWPGEFHGLYSPMGHKELLSLHQCPNVKMYIVYPKVDYFISIKDNEISLNIPTRYICKSCYIECIACLQWLNLKVKIYACMKTELHIQRAWEEAHSASDCCYMCKGRAWKHCWRYSHFTCIFLHC